MADAREEHVWTNHAAEQLKIPAFDPSSAWRWATFHAALTEEPWGSVMDFGCGTGLWRNFFRPGIYIGVDQNPAMIAGARKRWGSDGEFVLAPGIADGARIPLEDGCMDLTFSAAVLQHNSDADKPAVLREIRRVLKTGGRYVCFENTHDPEWNCPPEGIPLEDGFSHTQEGWRSVVEPHGFLCVKQDRDLHVYRAV